MHDDAHISGLSEKTFTSDFLFHSCGTYSVLSQSHFIWLCYVFCVSASSACNVTKGAMPVLVVLSSGAYFYVYMPTDA